MPTSAPFSDEFSGDFDLILGCAVRDIENDGRLYQQPEVVEAIIETQPAGLAPPNDGAGDYTGDAVDRFDLVSVEDRRFYEARIGNKKAPTTASLEAQSRPLT